MFREVLVEAFCDELTKLGASVATRLSKPPTVSKLQNAALKTPKIPIQTKLPSHNALPLPPPSPMSTIQPLVAKIG